MEKTWEIFMKTGKVTDYLSYRSSFAVEDGYASCHFKKENRLQADRSTACEIASEWLDKKEL